MADPGATEKGRVQRIDVIDLECIVVLMNTSNTRPSHIIILSYLDRILMNVLHLF